MQTDIAPMADEPMVDAPMVDEPMVDESSSVPEVLPANDEQALERETLTLVQQAEAFVIDSPESFLRANEIIASLKARKKDVTDWFAEPVARAHAAWKALTSRRAEMTDPIDQAVSVLSAKYVAYDRKCKAEAEALRRKQEQEELAREQERLRKEAEQREAEAREREREAAELAAQAEAAETREEAAILEAQAADLKEEAVATREEAQQVREEAKHVEAPVIPVRSAAPKPKGASVRENWTFEMDDFGALIQAVARGEVPRAALQPNEIWLRQTARANKDTMKVPGVRFYDAGSLAHRRAR